MKTNTNPLYLVELMNAAPRCTATSKRSGGPCRAPAVKGWRVCRFHGARGGAPSGERHGMYRHGARTKEAVSFRKLASMIGRFSKN